MRPGLPRLLQARADVYFPALAAAFPGALFPPPIRPVPLEFRLLGMSDVGRLRTRNEDAFRVLPELGLAVVADGMGGHPGGDVASRIAADTVVEALSGALAGAPRGRPSGSASPDTLSGAMRASILRAHERIRSEGDRVPELSGMGTTLTALALGRASDSWVLGHVGDSRAYRLRQGTLTPLTRDDTWVQEQVDAGELTPAEARRHPYAHVLTQCLGLEDTPAPYIGEGRALPGDAFLLCTDGLVGMLDDALIERILNDALGSAGEEAALAALLDAANEAGGLDNVTAVLLTVGPGSEQGDPTGSRPGG